VVDDDPAIREMLRHALQLDGHNVAEVKDGKAAWQVIKAHRPAVVIIDVMMPGMDGLELCRRVKAENKEIKLIIYTAGMATEAEALAAGADAYVHKGRPVKALRDAVRRFAGGAGPSTGPLCALPAF
jgi:two-component system response regulator MprA